MPPSSSYSVNTTDSENPNSTSYQTRGEAIRRLYDNWSSERSETTRRRLIRRIDVDNEVLRRRGDIAADESFVAIRLIDSNISKEKPTFVNYLRNSHRQAVFSPIDGVYDGVELLEQFYTRGMSYMRWEIPHIKAQDGASVHGWDAVELKFDKSVPFHIRAEHVGHDKLWFNLDVEDIQDAAYIGRDLVISKRKLKDWVTSFGFNKEQVDFILDKDSNSNREQHATVIISKVWFRNKDNEVMVGYWHRDAQDWLKSPSLAHVGLVKENGSPEAITKYPIILLTYTESEEPEIVSTLGRVWLDRYKQEAVCTLWSTAVTGATRSANLYASPNNASDQPIAPLQGLQLEGNTMYNQPINFHTPPAPSPQLVDFASKLETQNDQEIGQVNFAVNNRKDSEKTATEIKSAESSQTQLSSVQLVFFANYLREFHNSCWVIINSRINAKLIDNVPESILPIINKPFLIQPSGDIDVIKRDQLEQQRRQDWPVVANTPIAIPFLIDILKVSYPNDWQRYAQVMQQAQQQQAAQAQQQNEAKTIIAAQSNLLDATVDADDLKGVPNLNNQLQKVKKVAENFLNPPQQNQPQTPQG